MSSSVSGSIHMHIDKSRIVSHNSVNRVATKKISSTLTFQGSVFPADSLTSQDKFC
jgi:hypothetical protein